MVVAYRVSALTAFVLRTMKLVKVRNSSQSKDLSAQLAPGADELQVDTCAIVRRSQVGSRAGARKGTAMETSEMVVSKADAAKRLGVSIKQFNIWEAQGVLPHPVQISPGVLGYRVSDLDKYKIMNKRVELACQWIDAERASKLRGETRRLH
jgi:hypothetical protein